MDKNQRTEERKNRGECGNYQGKDRRRENDPTYFGYFALEGIERRRCGGFFA